MESPERPSFFRSESPFPVKDGFVKRFDLSVNSLHECLCLLFSRIERVILSNLWTIDPNERYNVEEKRLKGQERASFIMSPLWSSSSGNLRRSTSILNFFSVAFNLLTLAVQGVRRFILSPKLLSLNSLRYSIPCDNFSFVSRKSSVRTEVGSCPP